jgi:metal-responsive CopG/Arc/MetJ family transcriptional regulator
MTRLARLMVLIPDELLSDIDLARRNSYPDLPPRTEAIRRLVREGLTSRGILADDAPGGCPEKPD